MKNHNRWIVVWLAAVVVGAGLFVPQGQTAEIEGQRPMMIVGDAFQFIPGAWSSYYVHDRAKKEYYRMYIATLERLTRDGKSCSWMEVGVTPEKDPAVVTRFLVEETRSGPGEILDVIVQVQGYSPFTVPESFYRGEEKDVGNFKGTTVDSLLGSEFILSLPKAMPCIWSC
jgi:hypothetical protein